ncbi:hypothetical protein IscW_ISCW007575 [Ixodes scapularis]|uniref:Uncharacterized protein n=1 Tax=Ixodes scapularis TaxID=6945 RepID=B7PTB9_IXOSC|nr:hypothetical protein IscW_ISCW007575 [Ixodes scapularis]|eukprot:XP_002404114.1 hypothetical protein IscW_ISCW007575 [Ixodes scapularis]
MKYSIPMRSVGQSSRHTWRLELLSLNMGMRRKKNVQGSVMVKLKDQMTAMITLQTRIVICRFMGWQMAKNLGQKKEYLHKL